jgi:hypothetical protein
VAERVNGRAHRTIRGVPVERLVKDRQQRPLGEAAVETDRRWVARVPQQPLIRVVRNDYSVDPVCAGRRVEVRVSQAQITAAVLGTGELAAQHTRIFAGSPDDRRSSPSEPARTPASASPGNDTRCRCRAASLARLRRSDRMSGATSELAHLFRALKAPATARALPGLAGKGAGGALET